MSEWDQFPEVETADPWGAYPEVSPQPIGMGEDFARSMVGGLERSVLGMQGAVGDVDRLARRGAFWAADQLGFGPGRTIADRLGLWDTTGATMPESILPSTGQLTGVYENMAGPIHNPQTLAGEYGRTIGEYLPAAVGGPQTLGGKAAAVLAPALASETAGQVARKVAPDWEKTVRVTTGVLGSLAAMKRATGKTTSELEAAKRAAYQNFDKTGAMVSPGGFRKLTGDIVGTANKIGFDEQLHPQAAGVLKRFAKEVSAGQPVSIQHLDTLRRITRGVTKASAQPGGAMPNLTDHERAIIDAMVDQIDDFVEQLPHKPNLLTGTTPDVAQKAIGYLKDGRKLNQLWRRSEMLDDMYERAGLRSGQFSMSGMENSLRTEYRQLAMRMTRNKGLRNTFTEAERKAIAKVAAPSTAENVARSIGKLAPNSVLSATIGAGGGYFGSPLFTAGMWGAGLAGKGTSLALTYNNMNKARNALMGQPLYSQPYMPSVNLPAASAAMSPLRPGYFERIE